MRNGKEEVRPRKRKFFEPEDKKNYSENYHPFINGKLNGQREIIGGRRERRGEKLCLPST